MAPVSMRCSMCKISVFRRMRAKLDDGSYICQHCAVSEIKRLRAMLPHTADGKLIVVGEWYYRLKSSGPVKVRVPKIAFQTGYDYWWCDIEISGHDPAYFSTPPCAPAHELYSTESAALVAQKKKR